jgi:DNA-binding HxlR family transcriptional regulator
MSPTNSVKEYSNRFPWEIQSAIDGIDGDTERAVIALLFDEDKLSFTEIQEELGDEDPLHPQTLSNSLSKLKKGGLIEKRILDSDLDDEHPEEIFSSYYEISEYGERFVEALFASLGDVHGSSGINTKVIAVPQNQSYEAATEVRTELEEELIK